MNIIIAGSRDFNNYNQMEYFCDNIIKNMKFEEICIISGNARGADKLGEIYAHNKRYDLKKYPANWNLHGKSAGYKRNEDMANIADCLIAFWDKKSKGTKHMIDICKKKAIHTFVCEL